MKLIKLKPELVQSFAKIDNQVMLKDSRPVALIVRLKFRSKRYDFAVPFRSNIVGNSPKNECFPLPPREKTRPNCRHGLHYIKMVPIKKQYYNIYHIEGDIASKLYLAIIEKNEKKIIDDCQTYLEKYENGICSPYATNIDLLIEQLNKA